MLPDDVYLKPTKLELTKFGLQELSKEGSGVCCKNIDYLSHVFLTKKRSQVTIFKTKTMFWLTDVKRENWTDLIINFTNFYQADRIIVPWRPTDRHQSVYHFDSIRQVIEWFDPCLSEPNHFCTETIANFIKVSSNKSGFIFYL